jgi:hypothetical protein
MRKVSVVCLAAILLVGSLASANSVWNPAGNPDPNAIIDGRANWGDTANWANGLPVASGDGSYGHDPKAVFNVLGAAECIVSDARTCVDLVMGDGGDVTQNNVLRVVDGGTLTTTGGWMAIGYNRPATLIVEEGGVCNFGGHLWWGMNPGAVATIEINGGRVTSPEAFCLGWGSGPASAGGIANVYINDGVLQARYLAGPGVKVGSLVDIRFGTFLILGDRRLQVNDLINAVPPRMTAFDGLGTVVVELINGNTHVTALSPLDPDPAYGQTVAAGNVELSWNNIAEPNHPGASILVDVLFGTDPHGMIPAVTRLDVTSQARSDAIVSAPAITEPTTYYWQIITDNGGPVVTESSVFKFNVTNDTPPSVVIETPNTLTWAGEAVQLDATITDDGTSPVSIVWSVDPAIAANVTFSPSPNVEDPIVVGDTHLPNITLTVTVSDSNPLGTSGSDTMILDVAMNACHAARGGFPRLDLVYVADSNGDCVIDLADLAAEIAARWLENYALTAPIPIQ